jgi:glucose/arabinose dehydrogenase
LLVDRLPYIRDVRQGPDGLIYLVTQSDEGGLFRLEPA